MRTIKSRLFKRFERRDIEQEVRDELRFHLELLTEEKRRRGMTPEKAEEAALKRFGNVERIKNQCVEISKRSNPVMRVLKSFLIVVFLAGALAQISSADFYGKQIGNMLMTIAALSGLLVYLRGLRYSGFAPKDKNSSLLGLSGIDASSDHRELTPLERVINGD